MPELSRFFGIVVTMYYNDHEPPHFHAYYGAFEIAIEIDTGAEAGHFPRRARALLLEWYSLHREELMANWERSRDRRGLRPIRPLE